MNLRALILIPILALAALMAPGQALAADGPGTAAVRKANDAVAALLRQKAAAGSADEKRLTRQVNQELAGFLDVDELGQRALADHWSKLEPKQRKQFLELLRALVEANYLRAMRANLEYQVSYVREDEQGGNRRVLTEVRYRRGERDEVIAIEYVLIERNGTYRAFDLITDGVGLVENYRAQFNQILSKEGFSGLIDRMKKKKAELGA